MLPLTAIDDCCTVAVMLPPTPNCPPVTDTADTPVICACPAPLIKKLPCCTCTVLPPITSTWVLLPDTAMLPPLTDTLDDDTRSHEVPDT